VVVPPVQKAANANWAGRFNNIKPYLITGITYGGGFTVAALTADAAIAQAQPNTTSLVQRAFLLKETGE